MAIPALDGLFVGDLKHYRDILVLQNEDPREGIPVGDLITKAGVDWLLSEYQRFQPGTDRRALLSLWSRFYFAKLTVPVVAANLIAGHNLPVALNQIEVILGERGVPEAFRLPHPGEAFSESPENPFERFRTLIDCNFSPLIEGWCRQVKVSQRVLWSNAANYFESLIRSLEHAGMPPHRIEDGQQLIDLERRPDESPNPMARPVRYMVQGEGHAPKRLRKHCCIRYQLPGLALCRSCPHIERPPKGALMPAES